MKILGVDTATWAGSVAIAENGHVRGLVGIDAAAAHAERLMGAIDFVLMNLDMRADELDGLAVSAGPGSFTGLRIGMGAVKGLSFALGKPAVGISTLRAMARSVSGGTYICPLIDAGRGEVYGCCYRREKGDLIESCRETVEEPVEFLKRIEAGEILVFGSGAERYSDEIEREFRGRVTIIRFDRFVAPSVAVLGSERIEAGDIGALKPNYIRRTDAELQTDGRGREA